MKKSIRATLAVVGAFALVTTVACSSGNDPSEDPADFSIDGSADLIVPFSTGGGVDAAGRTVASILTDEGIVSHDIRVENREGGSGLVGMTYIVSQKGAEDTLMVTGAHIVSTPLLQETDIAYSDFTPLATLYADYVYFFVAPDSEITSLEDLGAALTADPQALSIGGSVPGGPGHLATAKLAKGFGVDPTAINYVPYDGDEALTALLGGHIDVASSGPEGLDLSEAGELRVIGVSAEEPQSGRSEGIPTFKEGGSNESYVNFRIISGPPEMSQAAVTYWQNALSEMEQTQAWQEASDRFGWSPYFQTDGLEEFLAEQSTEYEALLTELGVIGD